MKISELIKELEWTLNKHGDMPVYTHGENGWVESKILERRYILAGDPSRILPKCIREFEDSDKITFLGE